MTEDDALPRSPLLAQDFEAHRAHLRLVAQRVLGSADEAEDAVQEAWLRLQRHGGAGIRNPAGWLTTVVGRVCLDALRARAARREEPLVPGSAVPGGGPEPEREAELAESVGQAMGVVLDALTPPERVAFVLHDLFGVPFDDVATVLDRTPVAARQLASRARRRVQGAAPAGGRAGDDSRRDRVVQVFLAAARDGDFAGLLAVLDPGVVVRADSAVSHLGGVAGISGRAAVARAFLGKTRSATMALVDGAAGCVFRADGRTVGALTFTVSGGRVTAIDVVSDPAVLDGLDVVLLDPDAL